MVRIVGIDPGSRTTGYGVIELTTDSAAPRYVASGTVRAGSAPFPERLRVIFEGMAAILERYQPDEMAIEQVFVRRNAEAALKLGQARGAAICATLNCRLPVAEYSPSQVKQAVVGTGAAAKVQVAHMVRVLLALQGATLAEDAADALAVALCHHHTRTALARRHAVGAPMP